MPSDGQDSYECTPEPTGSGGAVDASQMPTGLFENVATEAIAVESRLSQEGSGSKVSGMEVEFQDDLFYDMFPGEGFPHDDSHFVPADEELPEFWQFDSSPSHTLHREQLVKFDVQRGEQKHNEQPLRHTSSGAASRHRAPLPFAMQRSHSNTELAGMFNSEAIDAPRSTLRKSKSDSRLVDRATAPSAVQSSHAKRSRR